MTDTAADGEEPRDQRAHRAREDFTRALRRLCDAVPVSDAQICREVPIVRATLSGYRQGNRLPEIHSLRAIYDVAAAHLTAAGLAPAITREELTRLLALAIAERKAAQAAARAAKSLTVAADSTPPAAEPRLSPANDAAEVAQVAPSSKQTSATPAPAEGTTSEVVLPVPPRRGDRQDSPTVEWNGIEELTGQLLNGRPRDVQLLLSQIGGLLPTSRIPDVVAELRHHGYAFAAAEVLHSASQRSPNDRLHIIKLLNERAQYEDAKVILAASM